MGSTHFMETWTLTSFPRTSNASQMNNEWMILERTLGVAITNTKDAGKKVVSKCEAL